MRGKGETGKRGNGPNCIATGPFNPRILVPYTLEKDAVQSRSELDRWTL